MVLIFFPSRKDIIKKNAKKFKQERIIVNIQAPIIITGKLILIRLFFVAILKRFPLKLELYAPTLLQLRQMSTL